MNLVTAAFLGFLEFSSTDYKGLKLLEFTFPSCYRMGYLLTWIVLEPPPAAEDSVGAGLEEEIKDPTQPSKQAEVLRNREPN